MKKIAAVCYFFDDEIFCESILKSIYSHFDFIIIMIGANKYNLHWCDSNFLPLDNTVKIVENFKKESDTENKIQIYYEKYISDIPFGEMKAKGVQRALNCGADWYFEIDAGEMYSQKDLKQIVDTIQTEKDNKLLVWPFYNFYPDFASGYEHIAGELRCFAINTQVNFIEDRRCAFLFDGNEKLWPLSAPPPNYVLQTSPGHPEYTKILNFYCYHLDELKPPINYFHRMLRRKLYKSNRTIPTEEDILDMLNYAFKNKEYSPYNGDYPEYLDIDALTKYYAKNFK